MEMYFFPFSVVPSLQEDPRVSYLNIIDYCPRLISHVSRR